MTEPIVPLEHSDFVGGSTAARRIGCPRSYALEQLVPKPVDDGSIYAREGTALHEVMAKTLQDDIEPTSLLPFTYTDPRAGWSFTVSHALWLEKGEPALTAFDSFIAKQEQRLKADARFLIEKRVSFPGIKNAFGTADIIAQIGPEIFVLDWKFGNGIVPAEENKQLMFYASGALNTFAEWFEDIDYGDDTTPVTMVILQPAREDSIDIWPTDLGRLFAYETELLEALQEIEEHGDKARIHDGPWCRFARCKLICPLHIGAARKLAERFDDLKRALDPETPAGDEPAPATPNDWGHRYADLLELAELVEPFIKEIKETAHQAAEGGLDIPGFGLDSKRAGGRTWALDESQTKRFLQRFLKSADYMRKEVITLPAAEKLLKAKGIDIPAKHIDRPESSGTKLVRRDKIKEPVEPVSNRIGELAEKLMNR